MTDSVEVAITSESNGQLWSVSVWDIITGSQLMVYKGGGVCGSHALSLAGTDYIIAAEVDKPLLHVWPINSSEPSHELRTVCPGIIGALAVSPNGKYIVAGIAEKVHVWQTEAGKLMCVAARHFQPITCIRFLEDSSHFVTGGEDGLVSVWQISMLTSTSIDCVQTVYSFSDNYLAVRDIYVGNGGSRTRIVSVSLDGSCRVYEFASGKLLLSVILDGYHLTAVTASVLESSLFLGSSSGDILTISLQESPRTLEHHLTDLEKESVFKGHCGTITSLSTSQDAITLLSSSVDETVRFWHIESKQCLRIIQHKGAVHNAFITYIPSQMFTEKLKPRLVMHRLQRASSLMENPDFNLEMMTSRDLVYVPYGNFGERNFVSEEMFQEELASISSEEVAEKSKEIEDLKKRNLELFEYAANKIFETHVENGVPRTDVVPSLININVALQQVETASLDIQPVYKLSKKVKKGRKQVAT